VLATFYTVIPITSNFKVWGNQHMDKSATPVPTSQVGAKKQDNSSQSGNTLTYERPFATRSTLRGHIDLLDPVTWVAGPQGFISGALATGAIVLDFKGIGLLLLGSILCGPLTIGFSQSINDFYDRELDALNEPTRPIPAGLVTLRGAVLNFTVVGFLALVVAGLIGWISGQNQFLLIGLTAIGLVLGWAYSAPPFEFKRNGLSGPLSVGLGYNLMTWITGNLVFASFRWEIFVLALVSAAIAVGLLIMNDLKSIEGDRKLGLRTLPVTRGAQGALIVAYLFIDLSQLAFLVFLLVTGHYWIAGLQVIALLVQFNAQRSLYRNPTHDQFKRYLLAGNGLILLVALLSALSFANYVPFNGW
jgi:chlorophyll synthase/bacteriochlorophyll c synthase